MQLTEEPRVPDHESDPARTPGDGWVDEGGASHLGPATHLREEHAKHAKEAADDTDDADDAEADDAEADDA